MTALNNQRKMVLSKTAVFLAWILSILGISVGNFGCVAYGPPDNYEEIQRLNDVREEVRNLESRANIESSYVLKLKGEIKYINQE